MYVPMSAIKTLDHNTGFNTNSPTIAANLNADFPTPKPKTATKAVQVAGPSVMDTAATLPPEQLKCGVHMEHSVKVAGFATRDDAAKWVRERENRKGNAALDFSIVERDNGKPSFQPNNTTYSKPTPQPKAEPVKLYGFTIGKTRIELPLGEGIDMVVSRGMGVRANIMDGAVKVGYVNVCRGRVELMLNGQMVMEPITN